MKDSMKDYINIYMYFNSKWHALYKSLDSYFFQCATDQKSDL